MKRITVLMLLMLAGCTGGRSFSISRPYALDASPPPGSPVFQQAYTDGCESALSGMGNSFIKVFHTFQYDASKIRNPLYDRVWNASNNYCRLFLFVSDDHLNNPDFRQYNKPIWVWN